MADFLTGLPLFCLVLTVVAYQIGLWCRSRTGSTLCNPLLIAIILVIAVLLLTGISPQPLRVFQASGIDKLVEIREAVS